MPHVRANKPLRLKIMTDNGTGEVFMPPFTVEFDPGAFQRTQTLSWCRKHQLSGSCDNNDCKYAHVVDRSVLPDSAKGPKGKDAGKGAGGKGAGKGCHRDPNIAEGPAASHACPPPTGPSAAASDNVIVRRKNGSKFSFRRSALQLNQGAIEHLESKGSLKLCKDQEMGKECQSGRKCNFAHLKDLGDLQSPSPPKSNPGPQSDARVRVVIPCRDGQKAKAATETPEWQWEDDLGQWQSYGLVDSNVIERFRRQFQAGVAGGFEADLSFNRFAYRFEFSPCGNLGLQVNMQTLTQRRMRRRVARVKATGEWSVESGGRFYSCESVDSALIDQLLASRGREFETGDMSFSKGRFTHRFEIDAGGPPLTGRQINARTGTERRIRRTEDVVEEEDGLNLTYQQLWLTKAGENALRREGKLRLCEKDLAWQACKNEDCPCAHIVRKEREQCLPPEIDRVPVRWMQSGVEGQLQVPRSCLVSLKGFVMSQLWKHGEVEWCGGCSGQNCKKVHTTDSYTKELRKRVKAAAEKKPVKVEWRAGQLKGHFTKKRAELDLGPEGEDELLTRGSVGLCDRLLDCRRVRCTDAHCKETDLPEDVRRAWRTDPAATVLPPNWEPQREAVKLVKLGSRDEEYKKVVDELRRTLNVFDVVVHRVQNKALWQQYHCQATVAVGKAKTKLLWHGTRNTDPRTIWEGVHGFDRNYCSSQCMWGTASYFAVNSSYSHRYAHVSSPYGTRHQLFLAEVLVGNSVTLPPDEYLKQPPGTYDSVNGHADGSVVYMVYKDCRAYPSYLVEYSDRP
eukprot:Hpha_TRINITY_DN15647_c4_g11::TRINITY_DN15647_c4_g11_i3::g.101203::m.101203